jgi:hypothetical protein
MNKLRLIIVIGIAWLLHGCLGSGAAEPALNVNSNQAQKPPAQVYFESPEHWLLASAIQLKFINKSGQVTTVPGKQAYVLSVNTDNGPLPLTFADLVWLAGDFIAEPGVSIGLSSLEARDTTFLTNFNAFNHYNSYLLPIINEFNTLIAHAQQNFNHNQPLTTDTHSDIAFNCATGGGCTALQLLRKPGLYIKLASNNYDHFGQQAIDSFVTGHRLALIAASQAKNLDELKQAYALDGYASHFLTDIFASGHTRTPRAQLVSYCSHLPAALTGYMAKVMHDEDNAHGLWLQDKLGNSWRSYGDNYLSIVDDYANYLRITDILQLAVNQVFTAYSQQQSTAQIEAEVTKLQDYLPVLGLVNANPDNPRARYLESDGVIYKYHSNNHTYTRLNCNQEAIIIAYDAIKGWILH